MNDLTMEIAALNAENARLREALRDLAAYAGGADSKPGHPCRKAHVLLCELDGVAPERLAQ